MNIKRKLPLIIGLSIPVLMVVFIALSIYLPRLYIHPQTDFLYCIGDGYSQQKFAVKAHQLEIREVKYPQEPYFINKPKQEPKLFIHDVKRNVSREISLEEANKYTLNDSLLSPDGFQVQRGHGEHYGGVFPFVGYSSSDYGKVYLKKGNFNQRLNTIQEEGLTYYGGYGPFSRIGWVMKEGAGHGQI